MIGRQEAGEFTATACCIRISTASISARDIITNAMHDVHDADTLVIDAGEPLGPQIAPFTKPGDQAENRNHADDDQARSEGGNCAVEGQRIVTEISE